jgi:hypothetical protein
VSCRLTALHSAAYSRASPQIGLSEILRSTIYQRSTWSSLLPCQLTPWITTEYLSEPSDSLNSVRLLTLLWVPDYSRAALGLWTTKRAPYRVAGIDTASTASCMRLTCGLSLLGVHCSTKHSCFSSLEGTTISTFLSMQRQEKDCTRTLVLRAPHINSMGAD